MGEPNIVDKIAAFKDQVSTDLDEFSKDLEVQTQKRKEAEIARFKRLNDQLAELAREIINENKKRAESDKALESMFETRLQEERETIIQDYHQKFVAVEQAHTELQGKFDTLVVRVDEMAARRQAEIDNAVQPLIKRLDRLETALVQEAKTRVDENKVLDDKVQEEVFKMRRDINKERLDREQAEALLREQIVAEGSSRKNAEDKVHKKIKKLIDEVHVEIVKEKKEREHSEEGIFEAINQTAQSFQTSLRLVNE
eukprot:Rmarinus@m.27841